MIEYINGKIEKKLVDKIIIDVNGIGYSVNVSSLTLNNLSHQGKNAKLYISQSTNMYSGVSTWYGFLTNEERDLFEIIKGIQKIGAKGAIDILSKIDHRINEFKHCITQKDSDLLNSLFGFTKKKSDKLILGLKDKMDILGIEDKKHIISGAITFKEEDAIEALKTLGYAPMVAKKTISNILKNCTDIQNLTLEDVIKHALKNM